MVSMTANAMSTARDEALYVEKRPKLQQFLKRYGNVHPSPTKNPYKILPIYTVERHNKKTYLVPTDYEQDPLELRESAVKVFRQFNGKSRHVSILRVYETRLKATTPEARAFIIQLNDGFLVIGKRAVKFWKMSQDVHQFVLDKLYHAPLKTKHSFGINANSPSASAAF